MFSTGRISEVGEVDLMEDDPEESRMEGENPTTSDLFDDHSAEAGDVNEGGELQTLTGIFKLLSVSFCDN